MKKYIGYIIGAVLLILVIWFLSTQKEQSFKIVTYKSNNYINNQFHPSYVDTILNVGLEQLGDSGVFIRVKPLSDALKQQGDVTIKAHIRGDNNSYIIWMDLLDRSKAISVLTHELIHLQQYRSKRLVVIDNRVIWEKDTLNPFQLPYNERPWEVEAFDKGRDLEVKIRKILY